RVSRPAWSKAWTCTACAPARITARASSAMASGVRGVAGWTESPLRATCRKMGVDIGDRSQGRDPVEGPGPPVATQHNESPQRQRRLDAPSRVLFAPEGNKRRVLWALEGFSRKSRETPRG